MPKKHKDYFSSREAADLLDVAVSTIQLWTNNGLLQAWTTAGGHRRIACSSVEEMLSKKLAVSGDSGPAQQLSVVVVEDDAQQIRLYEKQFVGWGMNANVVTARDGYQGLIKIGQTLPDVIITDLIMPNIDGFQMIKALKDMPELEHCLIIVVSGLSKNEVMVRGGLPEGVHLFRKPVPFKDVENLLRQKVQSKVA
jgi:excisionase family DNA binding protein